MSGSETEEPAKDEQAEELSAPASSAMRRVLRLGFRLSLPVLLGAVGLTIYEMETSHFQAQHFAEIAKELTFQIEDGSSDQIHFPTAGPYDERHGYVDLPVFIDRLESNGYRVEQQARWSKTMLETHDGRLFPAYDEKMQAGLLVEDMFGDPVYQARWPRSIYRTLDDVPPIIVDTLLFIENRTLLDYEPVTRNPAVEWKRLLRSIVENGLDEIGFDRGRPPGASTLATQLEKFRHSPEGRTDDVDEKFRQMLSASLRAYRDGENTYAARRRVALHYINGLPLSALRRVGEIFGIRDGLRSWFDADPDEVDRLLRGAESPDSDVSDVSERGAAYRQVVALLLATRRPTHFLRRNRMQLDELTDSYLRLMRDEGVVPQELAEAAIDTRVSAVPVTEAADPVEFATVKIETAVRTMIRDRIGARSLYELDRLDLTVRSTIDQKVSHAIRERLSSLADPAVVEREGLVRRSLLPEGSAEGLLFSFTLYEHTEFGNALRVQVDTHPEPLNLNEGVKLDLGSTAKLRTLATYLHVVSESFSELSRLPSPELEALQIADGDALTRWVHTELKRAPEITLEALLERAMQRTYSASPAEQFFTGGGAHRFSNFSSRHNGQRLTVREAFRHSVNLPFIRLMRDVVRYYVPRVDNTGPTIFSDPTHPGRLPRLKRSAQRESIEYLARFRDRYSGMSHSEAVERLIASKTKWYPLRLAVALRSAAPEMAFEAFDTTVRKYSDRRLTDSDVRKLYDDHGPGTFDWHDRGYLAKVHPLELWWIDHLRKHPDADWKEALKASAGVRSEVYEWLFDARHKRAQDTRIRIELEEEAFEPIHSHWAKLGFPFETLVPSLATAIGASADRPDSLARLIGTIAHGGIPHDRYVADLFHFALGTPYETKLRREPHEGRAIMREPVAAQLREELFGVVNSGTAQRISRVEPYRTNPDWALGGKTGTGDHQKKTFNSSGRVIAEEPVSRSATFVFFLGERFFGTLTVFVTGEKSSEYSFTSSLPVTLLGMLAPELQPLVSPVVSTDDPDAEFHMERAPLEDDPVREDAPLEEIIDPFLPLVSAPWDLEQE